MFAPLASVSLAPHTTLDLGGAARWFFPVTNRDEIQSGYRWARDRGIAVTLLGGGSNVVVADEGVDGLVLHMKMRGTRLAREAEGVQLTASAGETWDDVVERAVEADLAGIECLSAIPGTVGATPIQNVGAYGQDVSQTILGCEVYDPLEDAFFCIDRDDCGFAYRTSRFKTDLKHLIVLSVSFALRPFGTVETRYTEVANALAAASLEPSLMNVRSTVIELRRKKSMVVDPNDANSRSAGSFFTNPVVTEPVFEKLLEECLARGVIQRPEELPRWKQPDGRVKIAAGWLIERAGVQKGERVGPVGVSTAHALALVHHGGGTTRQLLALAHTIRQRVEDSFGVRLRPEPVLLGGQDDLWSTE